MQRSISAFETLAQIALLFVTARFFPAHRMPICLKSLSDNSGAESGSNKLWSMAYPLSIFLERMCLLSATLGIEIDVSHIPGSQNVLADDLSRWDQTGPPPHSFQLQIASVSRCQPCGTFVDHQLSCQRKLQFHGHCPAPDFLFPPCWNSPHVFNWGIVGRVEFPDSFLLGVRYPSVHSTK